MREIGTNNSDHHRIQIFDQGAGGILVLPAHACQAICDVQIQVVADDDTRSDHGVTEKENRKFCRELGKFAALRMGGADNISNPKSQIPKKIPSSKLQTLGSWELSYQ